MILQGQTPNFQSPFLLVGAGRLARHLSFAFTTLNLPHVTWDRSRPVEDLHSLLSKVDHVGLAISDDALESFVAQHLTNRPHLKVVHFSGAKHIPGTIVAHPLMSFGGELFPPEFYRRLHFVITGCDRLEEALPGWKNSFTVMGSEDRARYHALCVMAGNFPQLIWRKCEADLAELGVGPEVFRLYVQQIAANYVQQGPDAVTGPLVRGDQKTMELNHSALAGDKWQKVYQSFTEANA